MAQAPARKSAPPAPPAAVKAPAQALSRKAAQTNEHENVAAAMAKMTSADAMMEGVRFLLQNQMLDAARVVAGNRFDNIEAKIRHEGKELILPDDPVRMTPKEAVKWLTDYEKSEQEKISINEVVDAFPFDGAIALMKALRQIYGWSTPMPPQSFFEAPPTLMSVDISPTEKTQIIWGRFAIPGIEGSLITGYNIKMGRPVFTIQGEVKKKYAKDVAQIAELTRQIVANESIYRGKAVRLNVDEDGDLDLSESPTFVDVALANREELIYSESLMEQINTNLFTPIIRSDVCRANKIPLKRGILLEGPYGTGKTLCAYVTAQIAEEHGWSFIMIDRVTALKAALNFGVLYQPCVIFCEDIDRETTGERTPELDDILNVIDGIASKGKEIMVVLTSNNALAINRAMMRPGRLDAVLSIQAPDAAAAEKLMRVYGRNLIPADESLAGAGKAMEGQIPAVIREVVERAKLYAISRSDDDSMEFVLLDSDLIRAAEGMKHHLELLNGKPDNEPSDEHKLGAAFMKLVQNGIGQSNGKMIFDVTEKTQEISEALAHKFGISV